MSTFTSNHHVQFLPADKPDQIITTQMREERIKKAQMEMAEKQKERARMLQEAEKLAQERREQYLQNIRKKLADKHKLVEEKCRAKSENWRDVNRTGSRTARIDFLSPNNNSTKRKMSSMSQSWAPSATERAGFASNPLKSSASRPRTSTGRPIGFGSSTPRFAYEPTKPQSKPQSPMIPPKSSPKSPPTIQVSKKPITANRMSQSMHISRPQQKFEVPVWMLPPKKNVVSNSNNDLRSPKAPKKPKEVIPSTKLGPKPLPTTNVHKNSIKDQRRKSERLATPPDVVISTGGSMKSSSLTTLEEDQTDAQEEKLYKAKLAEQRRLAREKRMKELEAERFKAEKQRNSIANEENNKEQVTMMTMMVNSSHQNQPAKDIPLSQAPFISPCQQEKRDESICESANPLTINTNKEPPPPQVTISLNTSPEEILDNGQQHQEEEDISTKSNVKVSFLDNDESARNHQESKVLQRVSSPTTEQMHEMMNERQQKIDEEREERRRKLDAIMSRVKDSHSPVRDFSVLESTSPSAETPKFRSPLLQNMFTSGKLANARRSPIFSPEEQEDIATGISMEETSSQQQETIVQLQIPKEEEQMNKAEVTNNHDTNEMEAEEEEGLVETVGVEQYSSDELPVIEEESESDFAEDN